MRNSSMWVVGVALFSSIIWQSDFEKAKQMAREKHELILLNFSGSDWCIPCIRMEKEIFDNGQFSKMADSNLVLVNADFPRSKKHQPDKIRQKQNDELAARYNPEGKFPFTVLLDETGKVIHSWDGMPRQNVLEFTGEIKKLCDARH